MRQAKIVKILTELPWQVLAVLALLGKLYTKLLTGFTIPSLFLNCRHFAILILWRLLISVAVTASLIMKYNTRDYSKQYLYIGEAQLVLA